MRDDSDRSGGGVDRALNIAFHAPLKAPDHPVPSGDRLMARTLVAALGAAGHDVRVISDLRAYRGDPQDQAGWAALQGLAGAERGRIAADWRAARVPDLWFCYHPYYKAPDLIGPDLCAQFGVPMVTCEASLSARRDVGIWAAMQGCVRDMVASAALNLSLTARDAAGLAAMVPGARVARLAPFLDMTPFGARPSPQAGHLVCVAMMRPGDKMASYADLAAALRRVTGGWHLTVAGDGPERGAVEALFAGLPVRFAGALPRDGVAALLARAQALVWPGVGEAYGLAYLEAQAAGVPVVAYRTSGVPEVVGEGGLLVEAGDVAGYARAVDGLLADPPHAAALGRVARARVRRDHGMAAAVTRLDTLVRGVAGR